MKPICTACTPAAAEIARDEMLEHWEGEYPAVGGLWLVAWERFIAFLNYGVDPQGRLLHERDSRV